jgi:hypothetical protein
MRLATLLAIAATGPTPAWADDPQPPTPFDRGRFGVAAGGSTQTLLGWNYVEGGAGVAYYVLDGLSVGFSVSHEFDGNGPSISLVSPEVRYVAQPLLERMPAVPYVGVFYKHLFVGDDNDVDSIGAHAGLVVPVGNLVFGFGYAIEVCTHSCVLTYPELSFSVAF